LGFSRGDFRDNCVGEKIARLVRRLFRDEKEKGMVKGEIGTKFAILTIFTG